MIPRTINVSETETETETETATATATYDGNGNGNGNGNGYGDGDVRRKRKRQRKRGYGESFLEVTLQGKGLRAGVSVAAMATGIERCKMIIRCAQDRRLNFWE